MDLVLDVESSAIGCGVSFVLITIELLLHIIHIFHCRDGKDRPCLHGEADVEH